MLFRSHNTYFPQSRQEANRKFYSPIESQIFTNRPRNSFLFSWDTNNTHRERKKLWLTQDSYIEKIANSFYCLDDSSHYDCPFPLPSGEALEKRKDQAKPKKFIISNQ